jgi:hypothetical protein
MERLLDVYNYGKLVMINSYLLAQVSLEATQSWPLVKLKGISSFNHDISGTPIPNTQVKEGFFIDCVIYNLTWHVIMKISFVTPTL